MYGENETDIEKSKRMEIEGIRQRLEQAVSRLQEIEGDKSLSLRKLETLLLEEVRAKDRVESLRKELMTAKTERVRLVTSSEGYE